ncbi:HTH-type transcriptional activator RhaR [Paenibacillus auburnensis]|uniref:HTH-type transcriptional activator RhaR n=1 Tax=Paenibacillus auburnensis TaxID=2905649 RepID=A0ABN8G2T5_9BACL|nr:response regulator [Paenibacillus auburnensis]CAH1194489.1 HTH-type transcriptional activator RhaR [Paenibacillus auburnensis]
MIEILLVDDESYVTESIAQTIPWEEIGVYKVHQAASGAAALEIMEQQDIDILVTDISMPGMSGLQLIETASERWPNLRSILLTGYSDFGYAKKAIQLQAFDYILKPVNDDEFIKSISGAIESLRDEWEAHDKYHMLMYNRKASYSVLRANLMHDLLLGRVMSERALAAKLAEYEIAFDTETQAAMLMIQLGKHYTAMDHHSISLMEYAIGNIAEELFKESFRVWFCKAPHDCLILLVEPNAQMQQLIGLSEQYETLRQRTLKALIDSFRASVSNYLKGDISLIVTEWFAFPEGLPAAYRSGLSSMFLAAHNEAGSVLFLEDKHIQELVAIKSLESLYRPPTLIHLLESKQWDTAREKITDVFRDMKSARFSREHLYEVFLSITNAFMYIAHKGGQFISQIDQYALDPLLTQSIIVSFDRLQDWALDMLGKLEKELSESDQYTKSYIIKQVHELVGNHTGHDLSVKTIADHVYLHPVYLSKVYKAETGEGLGDYIIRMRMERALYLLKNTNKKIYEITTELGYQNPQYFSKMFKKHYGMTPNEFRDG